MRRTSRAVRGLAFAVLAGAACAGGGRAAPAAPGAAQTAGGPSLEHGLAGCYHLRLGAWSRSFPSGWPEVHQPPEVVRLEPVAADTPGGGWYRLRPQLAVLAGRPRAFPPAWRLRGDDRIELRWSSGFSGVRLTLSPASADTLRGEAVALYDVIVEGERVPSAPAVATRVPCPS